MSNNKKSSVEWLNDELASLNFDYLTSQIGNKEYNERHNQILEQAKEMHKEESFKIFKAGQDSMEEGGKGFEQYYNEKFGGNNEY